MTTMDFEEEEEIDKLLTSCTTRDQDNIDRISSLPDQQKKKKRLTSCTTRDQDNIDRISSLPDQLLHHILSFSDAHSAVQTSVLSKRWKLVWTRLPFLNFTSSRNLSSFTSEIRFIDNVLFCRNPDTPVFKLNICLHSHVEFRTPLIDCCINYAISHNVQELYVVIPGFDYLDAIALSSPSYLCSSTINKLVLKLNFGELLENSDCCWRLPALKTLHLIRPDYSKSYKLPESYLVCLPSLRTLVLDGFELPNSISLPALQTLVLHIVEFPENMSEFCRVFQALGNLRNLTLFFWTTLMADCVITCPELVNLEINYSTSKTGKSIETSNSGKIMVLASKIRNFSSIGIFPIKFGVYQLENVSIQVQDCAGIKTAELSKQKESFCEKVTDMFSQLGGAKILTLDLKTMEALSAISDILVSSSSPFYELEYVKVPHGFKESSMSTYLRWYLLGKCPEATIVTTLPKKASSFDSVRQNPLTAPAKVSVGSDKLHKKVIADRVTHVGVPVEGTGNDQVSSSRRDSDFGLWRGHEVNSEFVRLLDFIMNKYPETFEHFTTADKKLSTMKLNMLCTSVNVFTKICMTQVDTVMIAEYRSVFAALQNLGFNVSWLVNRLNYIEQLRFSQPLLPELHAIESRIDNAKVKLHDLQILVDDTKIELQDLRALRTEKMQEIQKAFGTMGTNLLAGCIGDDLLSGL